MAAVLIFGVASAVLTLLLVGVIVCGRKISAEKGGARGNGWLAREKAIRVHRRWGYALAGFVTLLAFVAPVVLEPALRNRLMTRVPRAIMSVHLSLVGLLLLLAVLQLKFSGIEKPTLHRRVGWVVLLIGIAAVATGMLIAIKSFL